MNHKTLTFTIIALLSTAPIVCIPTSRYNEPVGAQKSRELKETLELLWGPERSKWRDKEYVSGIQLTPFGGVSLREREEILPSFDEPFEFGSVVLSDLIKKQDASTEKIMPLEAAHAQTDGVNYERLAESLEELHTFNTLQAQINKLSHLDEID